MSRNDTISVRCRSFAPRPSANLFARPSFAEKHEHKNADHDVRS